MTIEELKTFLMKRSSYKNEEELLYDALVALLEKKINEELKTFLRRDKKKIVVKTEQN